MNGRTMTANAARHVFHVRITFETCSSLRLDGAWLAAPTQRERSDHGTLAQQS